MGLLTSFNSGVSALKASQAGLNTTAHNLANTKTPGYSRQQNIAADMTYQRYKVTTKGIMQIGYGTAVKAVRQNRDIFLDREYRLEVSHQNFYDRLYDTVNEIEDVFGEMEGVEFQYSMENIWNALQDLSRNPDVIVDRQLFISECGAFAENAANVYKALINYQTGLNTEINKQVATINKIGDRIAKLNDKIAYSESSGLENANDYRDERNLLMDRLAELTYYTYYETGNGRVNITINSAPFVMENKSYHMGTEKIRTMVERNGKLETTFVSWFDKVVWLDNGFDDVYDTDTAYSSAKKTDTGSLLGILTARGNFRANYTDMPVAPDEKDYLKADGTLDLDAYKLAKYQYEVEVDEFNNTTGNSIMTKIEAQFDQLVHGIVTMINDILCPNTDTGKLANAVTGTLKDGSTWTGTAGSSYKVLDVNNCPVGTDDDVTIGEELFSRNGYDRYQVVTLGAQVYAVDENGAQIKDENGNPIGLARETEDGKFELYVYQEEDPDEKFTLYTAQNLVINPKVLENYSLLPVKTNPAQGGTAAYDRAIYDKILTAWQKDFAALDPNTLTTFSYDDYYSEMIGGLATQGSVWKNVLENQTSMTESIDDKRQQVAGVSSDEELVELLKYQHAYNAASRYINVVDEMLQNLIERLA